MQINEILALKSRDEDKNIGLMNSYLKLAELNANIESIIEIIDKMDSMVTEIDFLNFILEKGFNLIPEADYARIFINNGDSGYFLEKLYRKNDIFLDECKCANDLSKNQSEDIIFKRKDLNKKISIELKINSNYLGAVIFYITNESNKEFNSDSRKLAASLEKIAASYLTINRYQRLQQKFKEDMILALSNLLGIHDNYTKGHNQSVANLSKKIAEALELNEADIRKAYWTGILHDIGKTLIPAEILNKKSALTGTEFNKIKKHPEWGYKTLKDSEELKEIAVYVLYHHEKWDGTGYPQGLAGEEIPLISQIVSLADAWDAMCSNRAYRKALSKNKAINQIKYNIGKQFSPKIARVFLDNIK